MNEIIKINPNDNMSFNIDNFSTVNTEENVTFNLVLSKEDKKISEDEFELNIEPGQNYWYFLEPDENLENGEYFYTLTAKAKKAFDDVKKGALLAQAQKIFLMENAEAEAPKYMDLPAPDCKETDKEITIKGENFKVVFDKGFGGMTKLSYNGVDYLKSKPQVTFWRPLTDTDLNLGLQFNNALWLGATVGQQLLPEKFYFNQEGNIYKIIFVYRYPVPGGQESAVIYDIYPNGDIGVLTTYSGLATVDTIPAFGMNFKLNKDLDKFKYYGYGPEENYIDTTEGLNLGVYETTVRKNFKKNERPQETGNRTAVRWAEVYNSKTGDGLRFTADPNLFEFDALPYNDLEIEAAQTVEELPKVTATNVRIAGKVSGIGHGDYIDDWALIDAGEMIELKFKISPIEIKVKKTSKKSSIKKEETKKEVSAKAEIKKEVAPEEKEEPSKEKAPVKKAAKKETPKEKSTPSQKVTETKKTTVAKEESPKKSTTSKTKKETSDK